MAMRWNRTKQKLARPRRRRNYIVRRRRIVPYGIELPNEGVKG
jgi:hypothetical protein